MISVGAFFGFLSVAMGAFGAHALKEKIDPQMLDVFKTGVHYMQFHAVAILVYAIWIKSNGLQDQISAFYAFVLGIFIFTGSLTILALTGVRIWGAVTPIGGLAFLVGWVLFAVQGWKQS